MSLYKTTLILLILISSFYSCKSRYISKNISKKIETPFLENQFIGLLFYNPQTKDTLFSYNAEKYFTPASNTKIFTLYTALQCLPTEVPAFRYEIEQDNITIQGTGNPAFLHPFFNDSTALKMASNYKKINVICDNLKDDKYGPGWAWEDYDTYFSPERSSFPMYGNVVTISNQDSLRSTPEFLKDNIKLSESPKRRNYNDNMFYYYSKKNDTIEIPMVIDSVLISKLWHGILPGKVSISHFSGKPLGNMAYSIPSDSLYKRMMVVSDNFLAEQMLIMGSSVLSDTLCSENIRDFILDNQLKDLKQKPRWVDGSGLSRYNLFTPTSFVQVLTKLYTEIPRERLFNLFPVGGESGTLEKYYSGGKTPYIYAKSGSLGNNYCLSGYLVTNSGKTLIFSFMNNHYRKPTVEVKQTMQSIFEWLRDNY